MNTYFIVNSSELSSLIHAVNLRINEKCVCIGGICIGLTGVYYQAMLRPN